MRIDIVSLFPEMYSAFRDYGINRRALEEGLLQLQWWNPREFATDSYRTVDDRPYGGGPGMVMMVEPVLRALQAARDDGARGPVIYLSPQGQALTQARLQELAQLPGMVLLAGRYEGMDERLLELEVDEEISLGDYVLSGGDFPAMVLLEGLTRLLPGALGNDRSSAEDSFSDGLLDCPHYTRPETIHGKGVPGVLLGGNHAEIARWRLKQALGRTWLRRPDLLKVRKLSPEEEKLLQEYIKEHDNS